MKYTLEICPWENWNGWQSHEIVNKTGNTVKGLLFELSELVLASADTLMKTGRDYSVEIYKGSTAIARFWISDYLKNGIRIGHNRYNMAVA